MIGPRRLCVKLMDRLVVVGAGEHAQQIVEGREIIIVYRCGERFLHEMISRYEGRVDRTHCCRSTLSSPLAIVGQALTPSRGPVVIRGRIGEQAAHPRITIRAGDRRGKSPEGQGKVRTVAGHALEKVLCQGDIVLSFLEQAKLVPESAGVGDLEAASECAEGFVGRFDGSILVLSQERQERLRQPREVPLRDAWLVAVSVAPKAIDGAIDRCGIVAVDEGAGTVVDGFAGDRHVVGVHDTVNEAGEQLFRDQLGLTCDHEVKQHSVGLFRVSGLGVVAGNDVVGELEQALNVASRSEELKRADANVA